jgi:uncharacterized protein (TIGR02646 family)
MIAMRRRDINLINPSVDWKTKAVAAKQAVDQGLKSSKDLSRLWSDLKPEFSRLSFGKCWYCESRQTRSDNAIDHFRPKSKYPWYAFAYENYRFACSFCNSPHRNPDSGQSQGKSDLFPLFDSSPTATCEEEIDGEQPILLDPCNAADVGLLDFRADGSPCPKFPNDPIVVMRVNETVKIYHLDHPELVEQRRLLATRLQAWIKRADSLYQRVEANCDPQFRRAFEGFVENIAQALTDHSELSVFARRVVTFHRAKPWIDPILDTA